MDEYEQAADELNALDEALAHTLDHAAAVYETDGPLFVRFLRITALLKRASAEMQEIIVDDADQHPRCQAMVQEVMERITPWSIEPAGRAH